MSTFTLTQEQYEALIAFAKTGATTAEQARTLEVFLKTIEKANGITRSLLWIQWQEANQPLPPTTNFPTTWPPEMRYRLELVTRPITKADVLQVLQQKARKPVGVFVTKDPGAELGWTRLEDFFPS